MKAVRALMLVLALSVCAYAGNLPIDGRPQQEPTPAPTASTETAGSNTESGDIQTTAEDADITTDVALNLIGAVLALF